MRHTLGFCRFFWSPQSPPAKHPDDDLDMVRVVRGGEGPDGPGGPDGAAALDLPPGYAVDDWHASAGEPQVMYFRLFILSTQNANIRGVCCYGFLM